MVKTFQTNHPLSDLCQKESETVKNNAQPGKVAITRQDLTALRDGDHAAFEKVYLHFFNPLRFFLFALLKSMDQAEEICQDTFANLWHNRANIDPDKSIKSYLYTTTKNQALNLFRNKKVHDTYTSRALNSAESLDYDDQVVVRETELLIRLVVSRMPKQRKKIFEMSRYEGLSNEEISKELGISKNAVEKHITFALKDIKEVLSLFLLLFM